MQHNGTIWTRLSAVLSGSYLRSTGTNAALVWSTLKLPNAITTGRIPYATTTDNIGESTNLTFNGSNFGLFASSGTLSVYHQGTGTQTVPTADFSTSITLTNTSSLVQNYTGAGGHTLTLTTCSTGFLAGAGIQFIIKNVGT